MEGPCYEGTCIAIAGDFDQCIECETIILTLEYNIIYRVSVQSINCRGESDATEPVIFSNTKALSTTSEHDFIVS